MEALIGMGGDQELLEAIVLASGEGSRLRSVTGGTPKCFYKINGIPLIMYGIRALEKLGLKRFVVVVRRGYEDLAEKALEGMETDYTLIVNYRGDLGSAYSVMLGLEAISGKKGIVACCDTLAPISLYENLLQCHRKTGCEACIAASRIGEYVDYKEASKIRLESDGRIMEIGKSVADAMLIDTGVMVLPKKALEFKKRVLESDGETHLYQLIGWMIMGGYDVRACDTESAPWTEIDTPEDLYSLTGGPARRVLEKYWEEMGGWGSQSRRTGL